MNAAQVSFVFKLAQITSNRIKGCMKQSGQIMDMDGAMGTDQSLYFLLPGGDGHDRLPVA